MPGGDLHRRSHSRLFGGLHGPRTRLPPLLRLPEPVLRRHADAGAGRQPARGVHRLGRRGPGQLPAHWVLVQGNRQCQRRQEGLHHQPHRRLRLSSGHVPDLPRHRHTRHSGHSGFSAHRSCLGGPALARSAGGVLGRTLLLRGRGRQVGPDSPLRLAARRHGRPNPGVGADSRRHHGDRRRVPGGAHVGRVHGCSGSVGRRRHRRSSDRAFRRAHRLCPERLQEGAGLFDGQPAGFHVRGRRHRQLRGRHLPPLHACLLQGRLVLVRGLGHARHERLGRHHPNGRACQAPAVDHARVPDLLARHLRRARVLRLLQQGRDSGRSLRHRGLRTWTGVGGAAGGRPAWAGGPRDRILHVAPLFPGFHRSLPRQRRGKAPHSRIAGVDGISARGARRGRRSFRIRGRAARSPRTRRQARRKHVVGLARTSRRRSA